MPKSKVLEQHIALFGESGSGKTVLLSSFYGPTQEKGFAEQNLFKVATVNSNQGKRLFQNYVGMRDSRQVPEPTKFRSTSYEFSVKMAKKAGAPATAVHDSMRMVWHDYPGEWFEQDATGEEAERRVQGFRDLMRSDVALLLVDAQLLIENVGHEESYLRSLFYNYRDGLERLRSEILEEGAPLARFPRIWMIALSKADLVPDLDVHAFKSLVLGKAGNDLSQLADVIASFAQAPDAMAIGDDFLLLSSARFTPDQIVLTERVGLDLILPIASVFPFEQHAKWAHSMEIPAAVAKDLLHGADAVAGAVGFLVGILAKVPGKLKPVAALVSQMLTSPLVDKFVEMGKQQLEEFEAQARAKQEYFAAVLARFRLDLEKGEADDVLSRSAS